ncbi:MAG: hypothetical protein AAF696_17225 [Bacteroidota bacterium]
MNTKGSRYEKFPEICFMEMIKDFTDIYQKFSIHPEWGFLPAFTPLESLGPEFKVWDALAPKLPDLIKEQRVKSSLEKLPAFPLDKLHTQNEQERAMLLLAHYASAYVGELGERRDHLPANLAVPFAQLADSLGRPAIVHHMTNVMYNWRKIDPAGAFIAENLEALISFNGTKGESWFYNLTAEIEYVGAPALADIIFIREEGNKASEEVLIQHFESLLKYLKAMTASLSKMTERLEPEAFYHKVRPFLSSFVDIKFEGLTENHIRSYAGGSAAQSSLIQAYDILLGVKHPEKRGDFLLAMRDYMPPLHKAFLEWLEEGMNFQDNLKSTELGRSIYQEVLKALFDFRNTHLKIVATYIAGPARKSGLSLEGTGGTDALTFLKKVRNDMHENRK